MHIQQRMFCHSVCHAAIALHPTVFRTNLAKLSAFLCKRSGTSPSGPVTNGGSFGGLRRGEHDAMEPLMPSSGWDLRRHYELTMHVVLIEFRWQKAAGWNTLVSVSGFPQWFPSLVSLAILGYTKTQIGPTKILEMRALTVEEARGLGCPVENTDYFDGSEIIGLRFEPFKESLPCFVALGIYHGCPCQSKRQEGSSESSKVAAGDGDVAYSEWLL